MAGGRGKLGTAVRHVFMDLSPLRRSADFQAFISGQLVSTLGNQLTAVAVPYQVYRLTHSSLYVGLVSLTQLFPLIGASLLGGSLVDAVDRRRLLLVTQLLMAACSAGLAINADLSSALWPLFVCPALTAGLSGVDSAARNAMVPGMVGLRDVPAANAMFQALFQLGAVAGPAAAGLLLAGAGIRLVYWVDVASFGASLLAVFLISPQPPGGAARRPGLRSIAEGFRFVRGHQAVQGAYLIDLNAMVFGLPRALFPALAATVFGGGTSTVGLLYAAPGAGALLGALTTGWVGRIHRQGLAVIAAVIVWGLAITGFGLVSWLPAALALLAVAGWADVISAVFRNTIIQLSVPDALRGRLMGVQMAVVAGGPRLGDLEAGAAATAFGDTAAVVSGGLACVAGAVMLARLLPGFRRQRTRYQAPADGSMGEPASEPADVPGEDPVPESRGLPVPSSSVRLRPGLLMAVYARRIRACAVASCLMWSGTGSAPVSCSRRAVSSAGFTNSPAPGAPGREVSGAIDPGVPRGWRTCPAGRLAGCAWWALRVSGPPCRNRCGPRGRAMTVPRERAYLAIIVALLGSVVLFG